MWVIAQVTALPCPTSAELGLGSPLPGCRPCWSGVGLLSRPHLTWQPLHVPSAHGGDSQQHHGKSITPLE